MEHEELQDTEHHPGCLAFFNGQIGLSFKGLKVAIAVKVRATLHEFEPGTFQPLAMSPAAAQAVRYALDLWEAWQALIALESDSDTDEDEITTARLRLNDQYDRFTTSYGLLDHNRSLFQFDGTIDSRLGLLLALETFEPEAQALRKADCFAQRTYFPPQAAFGQIYFDEAVGDRLLKAYAKSLNEYNEIEIDQIAEWCGVAIVDAERTLVEDLGLVVREPILPKGSGHRGSVGNVVVV